MSLFDNELDRAVLIQDKALAAIKEAQKEKIAELKRKSNEAVVTATLQVQAQLAERSCEEFAKTKWAGNWAQGCRKPTVKE